MQDNKHKILTWISCTVQISCKSKSICYSTVVCSEVLFTTDSPAVILSDVFDELRRDVVDVDDAWLYLFSELGVVRFVPPFRRFGETGGPCHIMSISGGKVMSVQQSNLVKSAGRSAMIRSHVRGEQGWVHNPRLVFSYLERENSFYWDFL